MTIQTATFWIATSLTLLAMTSGVAVAAINIPFTINLSENVTVTGTPRIAVDVGGNQRFANYTSGTGTNALTFTLSPNIGDVDLDGVTVSSPIDLNGGTIKDTSGNDASLTFTPPTTSGIKINYPSLGMDFTNGTSGRYTLNGTAYNSLSSFLAASGGTFARNSIATYYDSTGTLQTASANQPRFNYDPVTHQPKGILIEESRRNYMRNGNAVGSVSGSPGTLSTYWGLGGSGFPGLTRQIIGSGTESGVPYVEIRFSGTPTITGTSLLYTEATNVIGSSLGQTWSATSYLKLSGGSLTNCSVQFGLWERDSSSTALIGHYSTVPITSTLERYSSINTTTQSSVAYVVPMIGISHTTGQAIDITLRIGGGQMEQAAFPTSYIPTTTATVTRAADTLSMPTSPWFSAAEGAFFGEFTPAALLDTYPQIGLFGDGTMSNFIAYTLAPANHLFAEWKQSSSTLFSLNAGVAAANTSTKFAGAYKNGSSAISKNGAAPVTSSATLSTSLPVTLFSVGSNIARGGIDGRYTGNMTKLKYYPLRPSNSQLQLLAQ